MRGSDYAELRAFAEVAEHASFARAAERLRIAPSTLSQTVRALEQRLGVTLLNRTTRRVSLTGAGARLLDRFAPAMAEMEAAVRDARDQEHGPRGLVRMHVPRAAYHQHVERSLGRLADTLPEVVLDLTVDDAFGDFVADGFDLMVRHAESVDSSMVAVALGGGLRHAVVASPVYLAANGTPLEPTQLIEHRCINWRRPGAQQRYRWQFVSEGEITTMAVSGPLTVSHCDVAIAAAKAGVGIAYVLRSLAEEAVRSGGLVSLLEGHLPPFEGWRLCHPRQRQPTTAVRAVLEALGGSRQPLGTSA
jgi:DNA-binding transcriptional LysR family regulator